MKKLTLTVLKMLVAIPLAGIALLSPFFLFEFLYDRCEFFVPTPLIVGISIANCLIIFYYIMQSELKER